MKLPSGSNQQPQCAFCQETNASSFLTQHSALQGQRGAGLLWAPWAVLLCWGSPVPETHSQSVLLRAEAELGAPLPSAPRPLPYPLSQLGRSAPRPRRTDGPKRASGSCIRQGETLSWGANNSPNTPRLRKAAQAIFSPEPPLSKIGKWGLGCPWFPGYCCFAGGLRHLKPTLNVFSFVGKQDWAGKGLQRTGASHAPGAS